MSRLLILILTLSASFTTLAFDRENLMNAWSSSVVIRGYTEGGLAYGSGVVVAKDKVITGNDMPGSQIVDQHPGDKVLCRLG